MALNYQKKNIKNFIRANRTPFPHCLPKMCSFATNLTWLRKCRLGNGKKFPLSHFGPGSRQHCSKLSRIIILYGINVPFRCPTRMLRKWTKVRVSGKCGKTFRYVDFPVYGLSRMWTFRYPRPRVSKLLYKYTKATFHSLFNSTQLFDFKQQKSVEIESQKCKYSTKCKMATKFKIVSHVSTLLIFFCTNKDFWKWSRG